MSLFMETTKISAERTVGQVQALLAKYGATQVLTEYSAGEVEAVSFRMEIDKQSVPFRLPCRYQKMEPWLKMKRCENPKEWASRMRRIAWRQVFRWIEAQCALIETGMVATEEVFFPYIQGKGGQTLFEHFKTKGISMLGYEDKAC